MCCIVSQFCINSSIVPGFGCGFSLSCWMLILVGQFTHRGHWALTAWRRLLIYMSTVTSLVTVTVTVSGVLVDRFLLEHCAATFLTKKQVPIFPFHHPPLDRSCLGRVNTERHITLTRWDMCLHVVFGSGSPGTTIISSIEAFPS